MNDCPPALGTLDADLGDAARLQFRQSWPHSATPRPQLARHEEPSPQPEGSELHCVLWEKARARSLACFKYRNAFPAFAGGRQRNVAKIGWCDRAYSAAFARSATAFRTGAEPVATCRSENRSAGSLGPQPGAASRRARCGRACLSGGRGTAEQQIGPRQASALQMFHERGRSAQAQRVQVSPGRHPRTC